MLFKFKKITQHYKANMMFTQDVNYTQTIIAV